MSDNSQEYGLAGKTANAFTGSKLTPLIILASILLGLLAIVMTPREEEPQIIVPMVDVMIPFQGAAPREVEERIVTPLEKLLWGIPDVEYIYSVSQAQSALLTVRFKVGTELEPAVLRIHHKIREHMPEKPEGVGMPLVRSYTIDDVPFLALTLHSEKLNDFQLRKKALDLSEQIAEIADISETNVIGGEPRTIRILPDPGKLDQKSVTLLEFFEPLRSSNVAGIVGSTKGGESEILVDVNAFFSSAKDVEDIVVGIKGGRAVRVRDVAEVIDGPSERGRYVLHVKDGAVEEAVTVAFSKRPGTNATVLSERVLEKVENIRTNVLGPDIRTTITRDYGKTAEEKSNTLIEHLLIATFSVMILIALALGFKSSLVVGAAVPVTLALTLLIYYLWGYTLNRVTLFALIFSIGILVDDAIVVVENIHRHLSDKKLRKGKSLHQIVIEAVDEVGNPTILATFTVIAAILPMAFVSGLMGPYMRPIPVGASVAMIFSLAVAFIVSPWAAEKTHRKEYEEGMEKDEEKSEEKGRSTLDRLYDVVMGSLLDHRGVRLGFTLGILGLFVIIGWMVYAKIVQVKMLPFDNKSEFQIIVDMDEGTTLEETLAATKAIGQEIEDLPELDHYQVYAGTASPITFNGLVRHYFLRQQSYQGDLQVNLLPKHDRNRQSHEIAKDVRVQIQEVAQRLGANVKVVEIPPGPPVMSTLVAEVYGPTHESQIELASKIGSIFHETQGVVDVDQSVEFPQDKFLIDVDRRKTSLKRLPEDRIFKTVGAAMGGMSVGLLHDETHPEPVSINLQLPREFRSDLRTVRDLEVVTKDLSFVPLKSVTSVKNIEAQPSILHKNLQRVVYVFGDVAGTEESPVYAIFNMNPKIEDLAQGDEPLPIYSSEQPKVTDELSMKWDGEWHITVEVFRDLGIAFAVVLILIYILVVGWFESFLIPIIIMLPIPLSLIGIIPGHWMFGAFFTATSMIGFIAGAGIIVRNSIILVDFIELGLKNGKSLHDAVLEAGEVRFRPMLLTAAAVVVASLVILFDPIFQGLAISLMMGEVAATLLSRFAVPLLYYVMAGKKREQILNPKMASA